MLKFEKLNDGKTLRVSAVNPVEFAEWIENHSEDAVTTFTPNSDMAFMEMSESYWANGWGIFTADSLGQMSECLVIAEESTNNDDDSVTLNGKAWTNIADYQLVSPLLIILERGYYDFELWETFTEENFKLNFE